MAAAPEAILYSFFYACRSFLSAPKSAHVNERIPECVLSLNLFGLGYGMYGPFLSF
jgi:hypothetical protein